MMILMLVLAGLLLGSFVNALVWRLHARKDWVRDRSECTNCHHKLAVLDLIPVLSWVMLRGKCRYCGKPIDDSPLTELALPALFVVSYIFWPQPLAGAGLFEFVSWTLFLTGFLALSIYDLRWFLLPDKIVFPLIGLAAAQVFSVAIFFEGPWMDVVWSVLGAATISGLFFAIFVLSKGKWIGFGDVKLGIVLGLLAGGVIEAILTLFLASVLGSLVALPLVLAGKAGRKSHLPFGPLLIAGLIITILFGGNMIDWYLGLLT